MYTLPCIPYHGRAGVELYYLQVEHSMQLLIRTHPYRSSQLVDHRVYIRYRPSVDRCMFSVVVFKIFYRRYFVTDFSRIEFVIFVFYRIILYSLDAASMFYLEYFEAFEYTLHILFSLKLILKSMIWRHKQVQVLRWF